MRVSRVANRSAIVSTLLWLAGACLGAATEQSAKAGVSERSTGTAAVSKTRFASQNLRAGGSRAQLPLIDDDASRALGIRKLTGKHLTLYTDLPPAPEIDELPQVFDAAVPQWCAYFQVDPARIATWNNIGSLVQEKSRFTRAGLLPDDLPPFLNGYQRGAELWLYEQPSAYYRRHLLLHEGTHAFMHILLGGEGPPWYFEGMAELLATHRWRNGRLTLNHFPADKDEVPQWGRIKIIRDAHQQGSILQLAEIMRYAPHAHLQVEAYGWSWAAAAFFDGHPRYRPAFRDLRRQVDNRSESFSAAFIARLPVSDSHLRREWQWYVSRLDYAYDVARESIIPKAVEPLPDSGGTITIAADRGWQSAGWRLEAGRHYRFEATGRYAVAQQPKTWWCEPEGVTIRYCGGRPLGMVLGAIVDERDGEQTENGFLTPAPIGRQLDTTLRRGGTLYLRVNDSSSELADNQGEVTVRVYCPRAAP